MAQNGTARRLPTREEIPEEAKWRLDHIYSTDEAGEEEFQQLKKAVDQAGRYKGRVGESALTLLEALRMQDEIYNLLERVLQYAHDAPRTGKHQCPLPGHVPEGVSPLLPGGKRFGVSGAGGLGSS